MKTAFKFKPGAGAVLAFIILAVVFASIAGVVYVAINQSPAKTPEAGTGKPTSLTPAYSSNTIDPTFSWHCFCYTTKYRVHVREGDGNFYAGSWYKDVDKGGSDTTTTRFTGFSNNNYNASIPGSMTPGRTYYWTVSCLTGGCTTADTQSFTVVLPDQPSPSPIGIPYVALDSAAVSGGCTGPVYNLKIGYSIKNSQTLIGQAPTIEFATVNYDNNKGLYQMPLQGATLSGNGSYSYTLQGLVARGPTVYVSFAYWDGSQVAGTNVKLVSVPCTPSANRCDVNFDRRVNSGDQLAVKLNFGKTTSTALFRYDIDGFNQSHNKIDSADQTAVVNNKYCDAKY